MANLAPLSEHDIKSLLESPQEKRMKVTDMLSDYYARGGFGQEELAIAGNIISVLAGDMQTEVRRYLSERIKTLDNVPPDMIKMLAKDIAEISVPVLEFSSLLTDEDLVEIVCSTKDAEKLIAVTKRDSVSADVSEAIIEQGISEATLSLLLNEGADISDNGLDRIMEIHEEEPKMHDVLSMRESLPIHVVERLVTTVSEKMRDELLGKYEIDEQLVASLIRETSEITVINLTASGDSRMIYERFQVFLKKNRFPDSFAPVLALCLGNRELFIILAAKIIQAPMINVRCILQDGNAEGFDELYRKMNLTPAWRVPCRILAGILEELTGEYSLQELYNDIYLKDRYARYYMHSYESNAPKEGEDSAGAKTILQLLRNSQLLARKEMKERSNA